MCINEINPMQEPDSVKEEQITSLIKKVSFWTKDTTGEMYLLEPYKGVQIWINELDLKSSMRFSYTEGGSYLCLSHCLEGRYEMQLPSNRYIYVEKGVLSIDTTPFEGVTSFTKGKYRGLEIIIDLNQIKNNLPALWSECGINLLEIISLPNESDKTYLTQVTPVWDELACELAKHIQKAVLSLEDCRFLLLQLLWKLKEEKKLFRKYYPVFLTPGQRSIVIRTEKKLTVDLQKRYIISKMAEEAGISTTSLKKYFMLYFGKSISTYMKEQRLKKAKQLLKNTSLSIADIANDVGYENQGKFGTMFREEIGSTPLEYRRLHRSDI